MRIILSRKGFDTSAGGVPSPILPDGRLISLPIPDKRSAVQYRHLQQADIKLGTLVKQLTRDRIIGTTGAHLDPDLIADCYPREPGWKAVLGQTGSAQGHLRKQGVEVGDLFLFFGLYREVEKVNRRWRYVPGSTPRHLLWGWLQVGEVVTVDALIPDEMPWVKYHPHLHGEPDANNTLYIAADRLVIDGLKTQASGAGVFERFSPRHCLTAAESTKPSLWRLPSWFYPDGRVPLSYHNRLERWQKDADGCLLQCAARGQEFVLDTACYPQAVHWVESLLSDAKVSN
ncbi:MAG: hypothetical protein V7731_21430 [Amphritea sp.]